MRRRIIAAASGAALALSLLAGTALAGNPNGTGQPSQDCSEQSSQPNGFSTDGFARAESVYANPLAQGGTASGNSHVVSQYDVACYQISNH